MDENAFWKLIDASRAQVDLTKSENGDDFLQWQEAHLKKMLLSLSPEDILSFDEQFHIQTEKAYRWDLWGAAYWIGGGCSDDGFIDFRSTLVSLGRERFEAVLKDPDHLANLVGLPDVPYMQYEGFQYIAREIFEKRTGQSLHKVRRELQKSLPKTNVRQDDMGDQFDFDDREEMERRYPKLVTKFPDGGV